MPHSPREQEVILLRAVSELITSVVNREVLTVFGGDPEAETRFPSSTHQKYFNIVLVDFLSKVDTEVAPPGLSYIDRLKAICADPQFDLGASIGSLALAVERLDGWLSTRITVATWMPSIDLQADLRITRALLIEIGGNVSKHNVLRLGRTAKKLQKVIQDSGHVVDHDQALLALGDVYDRFHTDILNYHSSTIAELLNDIRWGIHDYLLPEYQRSFTQDPDGGIKYSYRVPGDVKNCLAVDSYWGVMNDVRSGPYVPRFVVTEWLKKRY